MESKEWRVDWLTRDGWSALFWFHYPTVAKDAAARWGRFHPTRLIHLNGDKAEIIEEASYV